MSNGKEVYQFSIPSEMAKCILIETAHDGDGVVALPPLTANIIKSIESFTIAAEIKEMDEEHIVSMESFAKSYVNIYKYPKKTYIEKLGTLQNLANIANDIGKEKIIDTILPILEIVAKEQFYDLKLEMLKHLPEIIHILNDNSDGYRNIIERILPVVKALQDDGDKVTEQANIIMLTLADTLTEEDVGTHILAYILSLAHDEENIDCKIKALSLLNMMAPKLGKNYCQQYVVHEVASLASEAEHQLRKAVCQNFTKICETVGTETLHKKLCDVYKSLANDTLWSVKKAAAEIIVDISKLCTVEKKTVLIEIMEGFLRDQNKWVKQSSHEKLGPFIISLPVQIIPDTLVEEFTQLCDKKKCTEEECFQCAFYFPGVLATLGYKAWPLLLGSYKSLIVNKTTKIKETLASCLHEFFRLLPTSEHSFLFECFYQFLKEKGYIINQINCKSYYQIWKSYIAICLLTIRLLSSQSSLK